MTDYFVADADGVMCRAPAGAQGMDVAAADAAVGDFYVDCVRGWRDGCVGFPFEIAGGGGGVVAEPAVEGVGGRHLVE